MEINPTRVSKRFSVTLFCFFLLGILLTYFAFKQTQLVVVPPPTSTPKISIDLSNGLDKTYQRAFGEKYLNQLNKDSILFALTAPNEMLSYRQKMLKVTLKGIQPIQVFLEKVENNLMYLQVKSTFLLPVQIKNITNLKGRVLSYPSNQIIPPKETISFSVPLDQSFDRLFVSNKNKKANFKLEKDYKKIKVNYQVSGISTIRSTNLLPWTIEQSDVFTAYKLRHDNRQIDFDFLVIDSIQKTITCKVGKWTLDKTLIIPKNYNFVINPGTHIDFITDDAKIMAYSSVHWKGTEEKPIVFYSSNKKGQGIFINAQSSDTSIVNYCKFQGLKSLNNQFWSVSGMVNFYKSPVKINHSSFEDNQSEDALNIINSPFILSNTLFRNTKSDAFDGDFVKGKVSNCRFQDLGNDAIDVSGSEINIEEINIDNAGDKAISAGENSIIRGTNITVKNCEIAVASKDLSAIFLDYLSLENNKLGFTAFQKKPEFGTAEIVINHSDIDKPDNTHLIEHYSSLLLNGKKVETTDGVIEKMYGGLYGKSSK